MKNIENVETIEKNYLHTLHQKRICRSARYLLVLIVLCTFLCAGCGVANMDMASGDNASEASNDSVDKAENAGEKQVREEVSNVDDAALNSHLTKTATEVITESAAEATTEAAIEATTETEAETAMEATIEEVIDTEQEKQIENTSVDYTDAATFEKWINRHVGSVGLLEDRTVIVSIFLQEPSSKWTTEEQKLMLEKQTIAYDFIHEQAGQYGIETDFIYDWTVHSDLHYEMEIQEDIPEYVTTEMERRLDKKEDQWIAQIPTGDLMNHYEADSIAYIFWVSHSGCSYSSMHFIADGKETWDESCLLYLRDMYSDTLDYETPAVFAHELLHLFGAEDLYAEAQVFSDATYRYAKGFSSDIMYTTYETVNGRYTPCQTKVKQSITPITAYLLGLTDGEDILSACPELEKEEKGCFAGSTYDRPF